MIRADIIVKGDVQMVGFRTCIKNLAGSLSIKGYAKNLDDGSVSIVCEGEKNNIEELVNEIRGNPPSFASIGGISAEYAEYTGEFVSFERTNGDIPKEATLGDLLGVMQSFDAKAETLVVILNDMNSTLKSVKEDTSQIREDTSQIKGIKEDTEVMKEKLTSIEEIHKELLDLRVKYNQLSDDVTEIKIAISELSESRVGCLPDLRKEGAACGRIPCDAEATDIGDRSK